MAMYAAGMIHFQAFAIPDAETLSLRRKTMPYKQKCFRRLHRSLDGGTYGSLT